MKSKMILITVNLMLLLTFSGIAQVVVKTTDVRCNGQKNGKATLLISNGLAPYKIKWSQGSAELPEYKDKQVAAGLDGGNYKVEITDKNDCMIEKTFEIKEPPGLSMSITSSTGAFDYCGSKSFPDVTLYGTSSGGTPPTSCSVSSCLQKVSAPGEYSFTVTDSKGCKQTESIRVNWVGIQCSSDPNDITGPFGFSTPRWVKASEPMEYAIRFENDPEFATAPAQLVYVEHIFHPKVNPFSLRVGNFGFGEFLYTLPLTSTYYQERLDLESEIGLWVDVVAGVDINENKAFWSFQSIDPATGLPPIDPQLGFLPVNDTMIGNGEGFVTFTIVPKNSAVTGDVVTAKADIIFDANEEITTNIWTNKLDAVAPASTMNELDSFVIDTNILISWSGQDDTGGCGVRDYALYYQVNGGPFILHGERIDADSIIFTGDPGSEYGFYVVGTDNVGNVEMKSGAEETVEIAAFDRIEIFSPYAYPVCAGDSLQIEWITTSIDSVSISMSLDSGQTFFTLAPVKLPADTLMTLFLHDSMITNYAQILITSLEDSVVEQKSAFFSIRTLPVIEISGDQFICDNEVADLAVNGANDYVWIPGLHLDDSTSANPTAYIDTNTFYIVRGIDVYGCVNYDSVEIAFYPTYFDSVTHPMCNEDSVLVGGAYQTEPGYYTDYLSASTGCDSTVVTEVVLTGPCPFGSPQVYVDKDAVGLNNGTSWQNAFNDLQDALAAVEYYLDVHEIWIAEGDYYPSTGNRDTSFVLRDSVTIYGGFGGIETMRAERSADASLVRISGDIGIVDDSTDNVYHVVEVDSTCAGCVIDGLTIQFGQADGLQTNGSFGAGLYVKGKILLENLVIERNTTSMEGAAIYNTGDDAILTIRGCLFRLNTSGLARDILNAAGAEIRFEGMNTVQE